MLSLASSTGRIVGFGFVHVIWVKKKVRTRNPSHPFVKDSNTLRTLFYLVGVGKYCGFVASGKLISDDK